MSKITFDATDIRILSAVQEHGQLSKTRLGEIVNLSATPCLARPNRLKGAGLIKGYRADIALDRIAAYTQVVVTVSLTHHRRSDFRRIEGGMLSYHADADIHTNPFELGFDRPVDLEMEAKFIGKAALRRIKDEGVKRKQMRLIIEGEPLKGPNTSYWRIRKGDAVIGKVTSAIYSPRLQKIIALALIDAEHAVLGADVAVVNRTGLVNEAGTERAVRRSRPRCRVAT